MGNILEKFILLGFFYLTYYFLVPNYYYHKKYITFSLYVVLCFMATLLLPSLLTKHFYQSQPERWELFHQQQLNQLSLYSVPVLNRHSETSQNYDTLFLPQDSSLLFFGEVSHHIFLFLVLLFFSLSLNNNNRSKKAQKEKIEVELFYLKAQINPHFLFNILNSVYSLVVIKSEVAEDAITKLTGVMRYMLQHAEYKRVPLEKEILYLKDYISLQKLTFDNNNPVEFSVTGEGVGKEIAPLILINFIENAFKYNLNAPEDSRTSVIINIIGNNLILKVRNCKVYLQNIDSQENGLQNVKNRLEILYPDKYFLGIEESDNLFSLLLHLWLI